ncbi:MAG: hypothetical protein IGS03_07720 [Candidatus Sericytochromatia bacterium]|nr:hypothetical protein [Candidatus Sericytochromatia bacterium]
MFWLGLAALVGGLCLLSQRLARQAADSDQLWLAAAAYSVCLLCWPFSARHWTGWANVLGDLRCWRLARQGFKLARWLQPDWIDAHLGLGTATLTLEPQAQRADAHFMQAYLLRRGTPLWGPGSAALPPGLFLSPEPLAEPPAEPPADAVASAHFAQQWAWLQAQGLLSDAESPLSAQRAHYLQRPPDQAKSSLGTLEATRLTRAYATQGYVTCDDLLQPEVLAALWQSCLRNTFWHHGYTSGYVGAYLDDGLGSPLLYQVAADLQAALPEIFDGQQLIYAWAFKCLSRTSGVALHYDAATVNVNLWLTPTAANVEPQSGGLLLYPQAPPAHWDLGRYQLSQQQMLSLAQEQQALTIAYRQNRAVIFDSRLLHASQPVHFGAAYDQQRINLTFLFGRQPLRYHRKHPLPAHLLS